MQAACEECQRLWLEYASAIAEHIRSDDKLFLATVRRDFDAIKPLALGVDAAEKNRSHLRTALTDHESAAHAARGQL